MKENDLITSLKEIVIKKIKSIIINDNDIARIAIVYDLGQYQVFPPTLAILNCDDVIKVESSDEDHESMVNPAEFSTYATPPLSLNNTEEYGFIFNELNLAYQNNPSLESEAIKAYIECSSYLTLFARSIKKEVMVFCTDPELSDLKKNIEEIAKSVENFDIKIPSWLN
ncbi:hypothetical protein E8K88_17785 [Lampropedia aestuarii]|uniref:Uncharacterized protein n=1 Tax=Lampropedia aestuarii TaxID=2562762 RepID=A0A4S5BHQ7_9BURK|nr:hypothetical protein [Lampropedia aestuarii]THJ30305.1 hypothetical protein E8K88_17785 [Lampropedia aestuarii]